MPAGSEGDDERRVSFQIWKWATDHKTYEVELFMFHEKDVVECKIAEGFVPRIDSARAQRVASN